jgi:hypothetical protein
MKKIEMAFPQENIVLYIIHNKMAFPQENIVLLYYSMYWFSWLFTVVREKTTVDGEARIFRIMHTFLPFSLPRQACGTLSKIFCTCAKISDEEQHQNHKNCFAIL